MAENLAWFAHGLLWVLAVAFVRELYDYEEHFEGLGMRHPYRLAAFLMAGTFIGEAWLFVGLTA